MGKCDVIDYQMLQSFVQSESILEKVKRIDVEFTRHKTKENFALVVSTHINKSSLLFYL